MSYQNKYGFRPIDFSKVKTVSELSKLLAEREREHEYQNRKEFNAIARAIQETGTTVIRGVSISGGGSSSSGSLSVRDVSGSVIVSPATDLRFDDDDGFSVTNLGSGVARVDLDVTGQSYFRSGSNSITTSGTTISFSKPLNNPLVWATSCKNGSGVQVGVSLSSISSTGFLATPIENSTLVWRAQPKEFPRSGTAIVNTTDTSIVLPISYDDANYSIHVKECISLSTWTSVGVEITSQEDAGFNANAVEQAILFYETCLLQ